MEKTECKKCFHQWIARILEPQACPKCKSYDWNKSEMTK